jgi:biopolymer transport protein TolR
MAIGRENDSRKILHQINVTPFVDVMLVLLVVFMVTAPMLETGVAVKLPEAAAPPLQQTREPLIISVQQDGTIFLGASRLESADHLTTALAQALRERQEKEVLLEADGAVIYERVVQVMAAARKAGAEKLGVVSQPPPAVSRIRSDMP